MKNFPLNSLAYYSQIIAWILANQFPNQTSLKTRKIDYRSENKAGTEAASGKCHQDECQEPIVVGPDFRALLSKRTLDQTITNHLVGLTFEQANNNFQQPIRLKQKAALQTKKKQHCPQRLKNISCQLLWLKSEQELKTGLKRELFNKCLNFLDHQAQQDSARQRGRLLG